jgi:dienelactone hydrolase
MYISFNRLNTLVLSLGFIFMILHCSTMLAFSRLDAKPTDCKYHYYQETTEVGAYKVATEYYVPDARGSHPLVFMIHGSAGAFSLHSEDEPMRDNFGEKTIARGCFVVALPHYLEAFGLKSLTSEREILSLFPSLLAATNILLTKAESLPSTKGSPVFLFGESLGGYLSVALALHRPEIMAVSEISGGFPAGYALDRSSAVAVMISHGDNDTVVPEIEADKLKDFCIQHHFQYDMNIYPGVGHYMPQDIESQCIEKTIEFFWKQTAAYRKHVQVR